MLEALARAVDELVDADVSEMCDSELRETFVASRRNADRHASFEARVLLAIQRRGIPAGDGASSTAAWAQWQSGLRVSEAKAILATAKACEVLPLTEKAWAQAEISTSAARAIGRGIREGHEDVYAAIEEQLVGCGRSRDLRGLDMLIAHYQTRVDALDGTEPSELNGLRLSRVGNRWKGNSDLDEVAGLTHDEALRAAMDRPSEDDTRTPAKRRADASTRIHRFFLDHAYISVEGGERPHVSFVIHHERGPQGQSILTADAALTLPDIEQLLCDARITRIVLDPDSIPLDVGRASYTPSKPLRRAVVVRDRHCRFPGCDRRPSWSQTHHTDPWETGGETKLTNLVLLCDYHHHVVHKPGWRATFDGHTFTVTNPDGKHIGTTRAPPR
jgi:Domain of unknown function (DUF222)